MYFGVEMVNYEMFNEVRLSKADLEKKRIEYEKKIDKLDDFTRALGKALEDDLLPDRIYYPLESAYERLCKMQSWLQDGAAALDEALAAWSVLEDEVNFVYYDVKKECPRIA